MVLNGFVEFSIMIVYTVNTFCGFIISDYTR